jgi:predicted nuclease of predicted toxin-antitoxin system
MMTRFLIDGDVNQKAVRKIPFQEKGFDVIFPEGGTYKAAKDSGIRDIAKQEGRVIVSGDKDFGKFNLRPEQVPFGVIVLRRTRTSQKGVPELLKRFCDFLTTTYPNNPYDFGERIIEVSDDNVIVTDRNGSSTFPLP